MHILKIRTGGEKFYNITEEINHAFSEITGYKSDSRGILTVFCPHTSCALTISEAWDPTAKKDLEEFLKQCAPRNLPFITHTCEGPDDSPSHMKSILLQSSLNLIIEESALKLGQWQGVYLAEFRDAPHTREIWLQALTQP